MREPRPDWREGLPSPQLDAGAFFAVAEYQASRPAPVRPGRAETAEKHLRRHRRPHEKTTSADEDSDLVIAQ